MASHSAPLSQGKRDGSPLPGDLGMPSATGGGYAHLGYVC